MKSKDDPNITTDSRKLFDGGDIYPPKTICRHIKQEPQEYVDKLLNDKIDTVKRHARPGIIVDLCCGTGDHLISIASAQKHAIGIDGSLRYLVEAQKRKNSSFENIAFLVADARKLPLQSATVQTLYSFSALYVIPNLEQVLREISRVLRPGGRCILDLGNKNSINAFCVTHYHKDIAPGYYFAVAKLVEMCKDRSLIPIEHRAYQILPMWTDRPTWLWPLLHPAWKKVLGMRLFGRIVDEWICGISFVRRFAFRHVLVCEKCLE